MDNRAKKFKFPVSILNQIRECSNGFFLVVVNERNEFEVFQDMHSPVTQVGLINFLEIFSGAMQENLRRNKFIDGQQPIRPDEDEED